jgi:hypothetical protein
VDLAAVRAAAMTFRMILRFRNADRLSREGIRSG